MGIKKLNLLYITTSSTGGGGVARILSQKTAAFVELGHQVRIISTNDTTEQPFYVFDPQVQWQFYPFPVRTMIQMQSYYNFVQKQGIEVFLPDVIFVLDNGIKGLMLQPGVWSVLENFRPGTVCLTVNSGVYDESDYIRSYDVFLESVALTQEC